VRRWNNLAELLTLLNRYRAWVTKYDDAGMTAAIHGRALPGSILERVKAMRGEV
jgi:hypothetical protein